MTEAPAAPQRSLLPPQLKFSLWRRIDRRLQRGEVLITTDQFQKVMEREFRKLLRVPAPRKVKELLRGMIVKVNNSHPEAYLTLGIKNAVTTYLRDVQARIEGESASDRDDVLGMIKQMVDGGRTAFFLESIGVEIGERGVSPRIEDAIKRIVDGQRLRPTEQATTQRIRRRGSGAEWVPVRTREDEKAAPPPEDGPAQAEAPSEQEQKDRIRAEREAEQQIAEKEMLKAPQHLDSWVKQDLVSEEEAVSLRELYSVNERLKKGEIDPEEAERIRSGMDAALRENIEKRLRQAVDYAVLYLNVFTALKRIPEERDEVLKFAIRHKSLVMATDEGIDLGPMTVELEQDEELLDGLVRLIDRRDQEVRMIAANMPPYRRIAGEGELISNLVIEEEFVDALRALSEDDLSERLNSPDSDERVRVAAEMRCILALISRAAVETPFHREVRRLKILQTIMRIYGGEEDKKTGRHQVQHFLKRRMPRMYPTMTAAERSTVEHDSQEKIDTIEKGEKEETEEPQDRSKRVYRA